MKLYVILFTFSSFFLKAQSDSLILYFNIDDYYINLENAKKIKAFIEPNKNQENYQLSLESAADYLGSIAYNQELADNRLKSVENFIYLITTSKKITITTRISRGEISTNQTLDNNFIGVPEHRYVKLIKTMLPDTMNFKELSKLDSTDSSITNTNASLPTQKPNSNDLIEKTLSEQIFETNVGENIILKHLNFIGGRHFLLEESLPYLDSLVIILKKHKNIHIFIEGHICCQAQNIDGYDYDTQSYDLSVNRAKFIFDFLVKNGISPQRMKYKGFARTRPLKNPELTSEDQKLNRRVEIKIIKK